MVKCRTDAANNLSRSLETCKMLKIISPKLKSIKISESVTAHQTLCEHDLGYVQHRSEKHFTQNVTNVTFVFETFPNKKTKDKNVGRNGILYCHRLNKVGVRPQCPPPNSTHAVVCPFQDPRGTHLASCLNNHQSINPTRISGRRTWEVDRKPGNPVDPGHRG